MIRETHTTEICLENKIRKSYIKGRIMMITIAMIIVALLGTHWAVLLNLSFTLVIYMYIFFGLVYFFTTYYYIYKYPKIVKISSPGIELGYSKKNIKISWDEIETIILAGPPAVIHKNGDITYLYIDKEILKKIYNEYTQRKKTHISQNAEHGSEN